MSEEEFQEYYFMHLYILVLEMLLNMSIWNLKSVSSMSIYLPQENS